MNMSSLELGGIAFDGRYALVAAVVAEPAVVILDDGEGGLRARPAARVTSAPDTLFGAGVGAEERRRLLASLVRFWNRRSDEAPRRLTLTEKRALLVEAERIVSGEFLAGMVLPAYLGSVEDAKLRALTDLLSKAGV